MGNDGGSIPGRQDLVKVHKKKKKNVSESFIKSSKSFIFIQSKRCNRHNCINTTPKRKKHSKKLLTIPRRRDRIFSVMRHADKRLPSGLFKQTSRLTHCQRAGD